MERARRHRLGALGCAATAGWVLYWLGIDILLSSGVAAAFGVSLALLFRINREFPNRWTGDGWRDGRWTALSLIVINFAALVSVQLLPLSSGYTGAVSFLIIFVGLAAYLGGALAEMERDHGSRQTTESTHASSDD